MRTAVEEAEAMLGLTHLTEQEIRCAQHCADGLSNREIARAMSLSESTVKTHISNATRKAGVRCRSHLVAWCFRHDLIH